MGDGSRNCLTAIRPSDCRHTLGLRRTAIRQASYTFSTGLHLADREHPTVLKSDLTALKVVGAGGGIAQQLAGAGEANLSMSTRRRR